MSIARIIKLLYLFWIGFHKWMTKALQMFLTRLNSMLL